MSIEYTKTMPIEIPKIEAPKKKWWQKLMGVFNANK